VGHLRVGDVCVRDLQVAFPDETLDVALRRMSSRDIGRLPVVARTDPRRLVGILRRTHIVRAYEIALARRATLRARAQQVRLGAVSGMEVEEIAVAAGASCAGKQIHALGLPPEVVVATIRRGRRLLVPRGSTTLEAGDVLAVLGDPQSVEALRRLCTSTQP
jgi:CIC family chloride channel protein